MCFVMMINRKWLLFLIVLAQIMIWNVSYSSEFKSNSQKILNNGNKGLTNNNNNLSLEEAIKIIGLGSDMEIMVHAKDGLLKFKVDHGFMDKSTEASISKLLKGMNYAIVRDNETNKLNIYIYGESDNGIEIKSTDLRASESEKRIIKQEDMEPVKAEDYPPVFSQAEIDAGNPFNNYDPNQLDVIPPDEDGNSFTWGDMRERNVGKANFRNPDKLDKYPPF